MTDGLGQTTYFGYDAAGGRTSILHYDGTAAYYAFDGVGRVSSKTDAAGRSAYFGYDARGDLTAFVGVGGVAIYMSYDAAGKPDSVTDGAGGARYYAYDGAGNICTFTTPRDNVTYYRHDGLHRIDALQHVPFGTLYYDYDARGRLLMVDGERGATYFAYDAEGRLASREDALGQADYFQRDGDGRMSAVGDADGAATYFQYNGEGAVVSALTLGLEPVHYDYDPLGRMACMTDEWGSTYWDYDVLGRPIRRQDPRAMTVYFAYGADGLRSSVHQAGGHATYFGYDSVGALAWVSDAQTASLTYYDCDGAGKPMVRRNPNGTTTYFAYDGAGRLAEKVTKKDADGSVLVRFAYTRDAEGNPIAIERESALGVCCCEHDDLERLTYKDVFIAAAHQYGDPYEYDGTGICVKPVQTRCDFGVSWDDMGWH